MELFGTNSREPKIIEMYHSYIPFHEVKLFLYRYDINVYISSSEEIVTNIYLGKYPVVRESQASYFYDSYDTIRHVLKGKGKRFAYDNVDDALFSLYRRTIFRKNYARLSVMKANAAIDAFELHFGGKYQELLKLQEL